MTLRDLAKSNAFLGPAETGTEDPQAVTFGGAEDPCPDSGTTPTVASVITRLGVMLWRLSKEAG